MRVKKKSLNDYRREIKAIYSATNKVIEEMVAKAAYTRLHAEIMTDIAEQISRSEMTKHEGMQMMRKWEGYKYDRESSPEEIVKDLGLESMEENFKAIYLEYNEYAEKLMAQYMIDMGQEDKLIRVTNAETGKEMVIRKGAISAVHCSELGHALIEMKYSSTVYAAEDFESVAKQLV